MPGSSAGDDFEADAGAPGFDNGSTAGTPPIYWGMVPAAGTGGQGGGVGAPAPGNDDSWVMPDENWATWPMPNAMSSGLPNPATYDVTLAGIVSDRVTGLMWQAEPLTAGLPWMETKVGCEMLMLGGYDDWRLPNRIELVSLMSFEAGSMTDSRAFPFQSPPERSYWSASAYAGDPSMQVWLVSGFSMATGYATTAGGEHSARCVRSTRPEPPEPHYGFSEGVVHDYWTGLSWQRQPPAYWQSLDEVSSYCEKLSLGGHDDWYLPSLKELLTIVDESRAFPAVDPELFPGTDEMLNGWFWSSTRFPTATPAPAAAPGLRFSDGAAANQPATTSLLPRCVRQSGSPN